MAKEESTHIIIADTQYLIVTALGLILSSLYTLIATVGTKKELLACLSSNPDALIIMDPALFDIDGYSDFPEIKQKFPRINFLILTNNINHAEFSALNEAGIKNIILKTGDKSEILQAIEATLQGKKYYSEAILDLLIEGNYKKDKPYEVIRLTATEIEIVKLIAEGLTTKEIAARKFISFHTVMTHRKNIFRKLGVKSISELIMAAIKAGWIDNTEYYI